jgi:hypothetical protein
MFHFYFEFIERLLPQFFPFCLLELLCSFDQLVLFFVTNTIRREDEKGQLLKGIKREEKRGGNPGFRLYIPNCFSKLKPVLQHVITCHRMEVRNMYIRHGSISY